MKLIAFIWDESAWFFKENPKRVTASDYMYGTDDAIFVCLAKQVLNLHLTEEPQIVIIEKGN